MWIGNTPPINVGEQDTSTSSGLVQNLGMQMVYWSPLTSATASGARKVVLRGYQLVQNNSGTTLAAGAAVIAEDTLGVRNGKVTTTTSTNDATWLGVVPQEFGTNTVANQAYFLLQVAGPGRVQAANTATNLTETAAGGALLGTATTAGYVQLLYATGTGTAAATLQDVANYVAGALAIATNTVSATAVGGLIYCDIRMKP